MPPVTRITKEDILNIAYEIVRTDGFNGLNARKVASKLNCSVQPIFHKFTNMDDLKKEVMNKILEVYRDYMLKIYDDKCNEYKNMGIGYIKFAKEEPKLFQIIFMEEHKMNIDDFMESMEVYQDIKKKLNFILGINGDKLKSFHSKIWIFTHGIATMIATHTCEFTDEQISNMLTEIYVALATQKS